MYFVKQDDGNEGRFPRKTSYTTVIIYIEDTPSPPVLDSYNFSVYDNTPANQFVGQVQATNPTGGSSIAYALVAPVDSNAFYMDDFGNIYTTADGSATINGLSTKKTYSVTVLAYTVCVPSCPGLTDTATYTITVKHTNSPPEFQSVSPFYILQGATDGSPVCFSTTGECTDGK